MIPLAIPNLSGNEAAYLQECVDTNFVSSIGPFVDRFEHELAKVVELPNVVATSSGTAGLHVALVATGVEPGDLVILPSLTFIGSANAIAQCGATPWLLDIDPDSWTLDPDCIARALDSHSRVKDGARVHGSSGRRIAAIMPVHTLGLIADMDPIVEIAKAYALPVVADGAACLGARYRNRSIGSTGADLTVFSFNGNKTLTAGGGGAVAGDDSTLCDLVKHLTTTARISSDYEHDSIGFNYRLTNLQAAVGCAQLEQIDAFVEAKRRIADRYNQELTKIDRIDAFPNPNWGSSACWLSGAVVRDRPVAPIVRALEGAGIGARSFWRPIQLQAPYRHAPCEPTPHCDSIWQSILTLPCSTQLTESDQSRVIEEVLRCVA